MWKVQVGILFHGSDFVRRDVAYKYKFGSYLFIYV